MSSLHRPPLVNTFTKWFMSSTGEDLKTAGLFEDLFDNSDIVLEDEGIAENKLLKEEKGRNLRIGDNLKKDIFESNLTLVAIYPKTTTNQ